MSAFEVSSKFSFKSKHVENQSDLKCVKVLKKVTKFENQNSAIWLYQISPRIGLISVGKLKEFYIFWSFKINFSTEDLYTGKKNSEFAMLSISKRPKDFCSLPWQCKCPAFPKSMLFLGKYCQTLKSRQIIGLFLGKIFKGSNYVLLKRNFRVSKQIYPVGSGEQGKIL